MTRRLMALGVLLALGAGAAASAGLVEDAVLAAQDKRIALTVAGDVPGLAAAMSDDLTWTHSNANVDTKADFLEAIRSGKYRYKSMTFDDRRVRLHGDATAIVSGTCRIQVTSGGRDLDIRLRFTELYVKQGGAWKMALWQSTRVPDPAP
jgi:ketosteroid isomerase-like protein